MYLTCYPAYCSPNPFLNSNLSKLSGHGSLHIIMPLSSFRVSTSHAALRRVIFLPVSRSIDLWWHWVKIAVLTLT
jgi:hypothetical protein